MRTEVGRVHVPQWMNDNLDNVPPPTDRNARKCEELPLGLRREVRSCRSSCQVLPVRNIEVDGCIGIKREARQIQPKAPIKNIVEREIAEVAKAIRA